MANILSDMKHLIGLCETAHANANKAEAKGNENEQSITNVEDAVIENYEEQSNTNAEVQDALIEIYEMMGV